MPPRPTPTMILRPTIWCNLLSSSLSSAQRAWSNICAPRRVQRICQGLVPIAVSAPERAVWPGHPRVPDDREHFARLSVCLDPPSDDLQIGPVRRRATFDESSVDANDHLLGRLIGFLIFGDLLSNLFVDALSNCRDPLY
jgi:hypothetical protein